MKVDFKFQCPVCDGKVIEEVVTGVIQTSEVASLNSEGGDAFACDYGRTASSTDFCDGADSFRCKGCGYTLRHHGSGRKITTGSELLDWLVEHKMMK